MQIFDNDTVWKTYVNLFQTYFCLDFTLEISDGFVLDKILNKRQSQTEDEQNKKNQNANDGSDKTSENFSFVDFFQTLLNFLFLDKANTVL